MDIPSDCYEEKPRTAPAPKSYCATPVIPSVPEVSLVFSPAAKTDKNVISHAANTPTAGFNKVSTSETGSHLFVSKDAKTMDPCDLSHLNVEKLHKKYYSPSLSFKHLPKKYTQLEKIGQVADKILEENAQIGQNYFSSRNFGVQPGTSSQKFASNYVSRMTPGNLKKSQIPCASVSMSNERSEQSNLNNYDSKQCSGCELHVRRKPQDVNCNIPVNSIHSCTPHSHVMNKNCQNVNPCLCSCSSHLNETEILCHAHNIRPICNELTSSSKTTLCSSFGNIESRTCVPLAIQAPTAAQSRTENGFAIKHNFVSCPTSFSSFDSNDNLRNVNKLIRPSNNAELSCISSNPLYGGQYQWVNGEKSMKSTESKRGVPIVDHQKLNCCNSSTAHHCNFMETSDKKPHSNGLETLDEEKENMQENAKFSIDKEQSGNAEEKTEVKNTSDTSLLQEIVLMNQKQCSILQGLLQQVVAMQADQMKVLGEINEKLSNVKLSGDVTQCSSGILKIETIQTTSPTSCVTEKRVEKYEQPREEKKIIADDSHKNSNENRCFCLNTETQTPELQCAEVPKEKGPVPEDVIKDKKFPERAVSWSAVRGVETVEESFTLHGVCVPTVVEQMPSSVHTMHLHMQDYHSSASFESISENITPNDACCENSVENNRGSWTLYDNIVGHVKKFLQTVPCEKSSGSIQQKTSQVEAIRFATIEKIRQLGVSVYENSTEIKDVSATGRVHFDSKVSHCPPFHYSPQGENNSSDASLEIQTLALKYLSEDDLYDLAKLNSGKPNSNLKGGQKPSNISVATQHYLEKYHLLPTDLDDRNKRQACNNQSSVNNILDITTLKKQPKLL